MKARLPDGPTTTRWPNSDEVASIGVFEALHSGLTVGLIATSRDQLMTCSSEAAASLVIARNTEQYDFIPVIEEPASGQSRIVGLFHAAGFAGRPAPDGRVRDHLLPLSEEYLIGADASILDFIRDADARPCRLLLAGTRISGLVSLSDLQKLPVRAALFALITGFELTMAEAIRRTHPVNTDWTALLSDARQSKIREEIGKSKEHDGFVDPLLFTQLADKRTIIRKTMGIGESKSALERKLEQIEHLRDRVAHANEYAATPEQARHVCSVVRDLLALRAEIAAIATSEVSPAAMRTTPKGAA
jgi:hypothetical protein